MIGMRTIVRSQVSGGSCDDLILRHVARVTPNTSLERTRER